MKKALKVLAALVALCVGAVVALRLVFALPPLPDTPARPDLPETDLGAIIGPQAQAHPDLSGVFPLENGIDAFAARVLLTRAATFSIDAQYYIWQDDLTGLRLLAELQDAARRGVHVRLLVDDNGTPALDPELSALDALPTAEVRIFNPFVFRAWRPLNYAFDFFRLNRRMHNKSMTFDRNATIVGGRNIGDVYFATGNGPTYLDLDVLAVGPAAADVTADFDRYWGSASSYAISSLVTFRPDWASRLDDRDAAIRETPEAQDYSRAVRAAGLVDQLRAGAIPFEWVPARLFSDDPAKALGDATAVPMIHDLFEALGTPRTAFDIISAYFIAGPTATDRLVDFARQGVRVRVLTNSLEATDVAVVHSGYMKDRPDLISGGVQLYELRSAAGERRDLGELGLLELSEAALHAKSFAVDGLRAFIGSMNFDPRSRHLNTEMGLLIDSPTLAGRISGWLDDNLGPMTYRVTENPNGGLEWTAEATDGTATTWDTDPNTTMPLRIAVWLISWLPIQWML